VTFPDRRPRDTPAVSLDAPGPGAGPPFLRLNAWLYRAEMAVAAAALLVILFGWRLLVVRDLNAPLAVFWIVWPDLGAFLPIGIASRGGRAWPRWVLRCTMRCTPFSSGLPCSSSGAF
jgi:hypothetical protein